MKLALAQSILKGRVIDTVARDATILGVVAIQPIFSEHTNASRATLTHDGTVERWHKIAVSSAKQCGQAVVPTLASPVRFDHLLMDTTVPLRIMLVEPAARSAHESLEMLSKQPPPTAATLAIGPEGGWTKKDSRRCAVAASACSRSAPGPSAPTRCRPRRFRCCSLCGEIFSAPSP